MALSRIWSAFIIIAVIVALVRIIGTDNRTLFSSMVTGKAGDTLKLHKVDTTILSAPQLQVLDSNRVLAWDNHSVIRTGDGKLQVFDLQGADGIIETCKSVEKKISRAEKMAKVDPKAKIELEVLQRCKAQLEQGKNIREMDLSKEEWLSVSDLFLLTAKPVLYVANVDEASMHTGNKWSEILKEKVKK